MEMNLGKKGSIHAVYNDGGNCLYITENYTAEMAALEGYTVKELPFYGSPTGGLAASIWKEDELIAAVQIKEAILNHCIALDGTSTSLITIL